MLKIELLKLLIFRKIILIMIGMMLIGSPFIYYLNVTDHSSIMFMLIVWLLLVPIVHIFLENIYVLTRIGLDISIQWRRKKKMSKNIRHLSM